MCHNPLLFHRAPVLSWLGSYLGIFSVRIECGNEYNQLFCGINCSTERQTTDRDTGQQNSQLCPVCSISMTGQNEKGSS